MKAKQTKKPCIPAAGGELGFLLAAILFLLFTGKKSSESSEVTTGSFGGRLESEKQNKT